MLVVRSQVQTGPLLTNTRAFALAEVLPRVLLLKPYLTPGTKLLTFGGSHEAKWLAELGIPADMVEVYDPSTLYCADELLVPNPVSVITPAKEGYEHVRRAFPAQPVAAQQDNNLVIYCTRAGASDRQVSNEDQILSAIKAAYPQSELVIYTGKESVRDTVQLFRRARVVVGMHGAGLSHMIFAPRGAAVIEFLFMYDPPLMFWHASGALGLDYVMVPVPQSWWLAHDVEVPVADVVDAMGLVLPPAAASDACSGGSYSSPATGHCTACPAGTYRTAASRSGCQSCAEGRVSAAGSTACQICAVGTYALRATGCATCPGGTSTIFAGSAGMSSCLEPLAIQTKVDSMFSAGYLVDKLVAIPLLEEKARSVQKGGCNV